MGSTNHTVSEKQTSPGDITARSRYSGACNPEGHVNISPGDNAICKIINITSAPSDPGSACPGECVAASLAWIDARDVFRLVRLVRDNALLLTELGLKAALDQCRLTGATLVLPSWIG